MLNKIEKNLFQRSKICPYWQKYAVHIEGGEVRILALCGRAGNQKVQPPDSEFGKRVKKCPYYSDGGFWHISVQ